MPLAVKEETRQSLGLGKGDRLPARKSAQPTAQDRRIARTQAALREALIDLVEERGLDAISVGDICAAADITRGTFYNHFKDKETLVDHYEAQIIDGLAVFQERMAKLSITELAKVVAKRQPLPLLVEMFDYLRGEQRFLHAMLGARGDSAFVTHLRDSVCTNLVQSILHARYRNSTDPFVCYYVAFYASAYLGVILRWIETGMRESSEEMARISVRLLFIKPGESIKL